MIVATKIHPRNTNLHMHASGVNASLAVDMLTALSEKMYFGL